MATLNFIEALRTSLQRTKTYFDDNVTTLTNNVDTLKSRVDVLGEESTISDAELQDIRVGVDGTVYDSAGEAVRGQVSKLSEDNVSRGYVLILSEDEGDAQSNSDSITEAITQHNHVILKKGKYPVKPGIVIDSGKLDMNGAHLYTVDYKSNVSLVYMKGESPEICNGELEGSYDLADDEEGYEFFEHETLIFPYGVNDAYIHHMELHNNWGYCICTGVDADKAQYYVGTATQITPNSVIMFESEIIEIPEGYKYVTASGQIGYNRIISTQPVQYRFFDEADSEIIVLKSVPKARIAIPSGAKTVEIITILDNDTFLAYNVYFTNYRESLTVSNCKFHNFHSLGLAGFEGPTNIIGCSFIESGKPRSDANYTNRATTGGVDIEDTPCPEFFMANCYSRDCAKLLMFGGYKGVVINCIGNGIGAYRGWQLDISNCNISNLYTMGSRICVSVNGVHADILDIKEVNRKDVSGSISTNSFPKNPSLDCFNSFYVKVADTNNIGGVVSGVLNGKIKSMNRSAIRWKGFAPAKGSHVIIEENISDSQRNYYGILGVSGDSYGIDSNTAFVPNGYTIYDSTFNIDDVKSGYMTEKEISGAFENCIFNLTGATYFKNSNGKCSNPIDLTFKDCVINNADYYLFNFVPAAGGVVTFKNCTIADTSKLFNGDTSRISIGIVSGDIDLPIATSEKLGGVMPVAKTDDMTQEVGVDASGLLYTTPSGDSVLAEIVPTNNLFDPANLVTSFVDKDGNTVNGDFTNYIKLGLNKRYVTNLYYTQFHFFDKNKVHLSTSTYLSNPQIITGNGGYLLVKLGSDYSNAIFIEGTDIGAYKEQHIKIKSNLLDNKWYGKRWLCIGDSISTDEASLAKNGYAKLISRELGMVLTNISVSGKTMKDGYEWLDSINDEYDLITVMLGTNNQGYNCALGSLNDEYYTNGDYSSNNSFYAQTQLMAEKLKTKFPKSVVMFLTPIKRTAVGDTTNNNDAGYQINALGFTTEKYRDVIIDVCNYYSLPYEDLYNCIDPRTEENRNLYFMSESDGTHPNDLGHALYLAPPIKHAIVRQTPYYFSDYSVEEPTEPDEPTETTYTITRNLIGCTSSSDVSEITEGSTHSETLTASDGYTLEGATVSVTMGDSDISSLYSNGTLNIESVNGNIVIAVSAVIESTGEDNTPVLLHSYSGTPVEFVENGTTYTMLEDLTNNLDLKANSWYKAQGVNLATGSETTYLVDRVQNKENWIIERNNSFSIKIKNFKRDSNYFSQLWGFHTGLMQGMNVSGTVDGTVYDSDGRINFEITAPKGSTSVFGDGELRISYYEEGATKLTPFYSSLKFNNGETHDVMVIYDKTKKNLKVYQDTELCIDETLTRDLSIDGICFGNLKYSSIERIEIYKGVVDVA